MKYGLLAVPLLLFSLFLPAETPKITFRDFSGVCQGNGVEKMFSKNAVGWNRLDINWASAEPEPGKYDEKYLKRIYSGIRQNLKNGIRVLPMLGYAPGWASVQKEYVFEQNGRRSVYVSLGESSRFRLVQFKKRKNQWVQERESIVRNPRIPLSGEGCKAWRMFVRRIVSDLSKEPYRLEYFQVWNEAHPGSGFYNGSLDEYMRNIHLPAAEEIKALGGKIVYGGFPCCGTVDGLAKLLTRNGAWKTLDVIDIHYFPEWCMDYLRRQGEANGRPDLGVWQTEVGFHRKYDYVPIVYPALLYWGLTHDWNYADRYKVFYFAAGSPDDPKAYGYAKCLFAGKNPTPHGLALETLASFFAGHAIEPYAPVVSFPKLEFNLKNSRIFALKAGKKIVVCIFLNQKTMNEYASKKLAAIRLNLPELSLETIAKAERVSAYGTKEELVLEKSSAGVSLAVPLRKTDDKAHPMLKTWKDWTGNAFYVVFELK